MKHIGLILLISAVMLATLFMAAGAAAQGEGYSLVQMTNIDVLSLQQEDQGCWERHYASSSTTMFMAIYQELSCSNAKAFSYEPLSGNAPTGTAGVVIDYRIEYLGSRERPVEPLLDLSMGANVDPFFGTVGTATPVEEARLCIGDEEASIGDPQFSDLDCDYFENSHSNGWMGGNNWGLTLWVASHDTDTEVNVNAVYWIADGELQPPPNQFGLSCVYTATTGITDTVSASRVLNGSFEFYNYSDVPSGWSINSGGGSTYYSTQTNAFDGSYSLQYQPDTFRTFAQVCRSIQLPGNTQSIAAGFNFAGGGSGTSDVTLSLDGQVLDTTFVSGSTAWTTLAYSQPYTPTQIFHQFCIEVQGANRAYIDATWLYASDSEDLFGLMCPAPEEDAVPPPPPPPPEPGDDGIPVPAPDDFGRCYRCVRPNTIIEIGGWIKWLLCGFQNLFRCELYIWLLNLQNLLAGLFNRVVSFVLWIPQVFQSIWNWAAATVTNIGNWAIQMWDNFRSGFTGFLRTLVQRVLETDFVQTVWLSVTWLRSIWETAMALIQTVIAQIRALFMAAISVLELIQNIIVSVATAWNADPYQIDFIGSGGGGPGSFDPGLLEEQGVNDSKITWVLLIGLAALDAIAGDFGFQYLQFIIIGVMAFGVIAWTLKQFQDIVPA